MKLKKIFNLNKKIKAEVLTYLKTRKKSKYLIKFSKEMLNKFIVINRLNRSQILQMVNLVSISNDINDLKDNLKWECSKSFHQNI